MVNRPTLARGRVDRDGQTRVDPKSVEAARSSERARFLLVRGGEVAVAGAGVLALGRDEAEAHGAEGAAYLGRAGGRPYFAIDVDGGAWPDGVARIPDFRSVRMHAHEWDDDETALAVESVAIIQWQRATRYCHECGCELELVAGGWEKRCRNGHATFPRIDPAVIMAIRDSRDRLLLGRNRAWAPGRHSVLAGFVEAGETLEAAVRREVYEETGIVVGAVDYVASQPWPFPRSLMLAFEGRTACRQEDVSVDGEEVEEARFYTRDELGRALESGTMGLPSPTSIASTLIDRWLRG